MHTEHIFVNNAKTILSFFYLLTYEILINIFKNSENWVVW